MFVTVLNNASTEITTKDSFIERNNQQEPRKEDENKDGVGKCKSRLNFNVTLT